METTKSKEKMLAEAMVVTGIMVIGIIAGFLEFVAALCVCCALYGLWIKKGVLPKVLVFVLGIFFMDYTGLHLITGLTFVGCAGYGLWKKRK